MERLLVASNLVLSEPIEHPENPDFSNVKIIDIRDVDTQGGSPVKEFVLTIDGVKTWNSAPAGPEELSRYEEELRKLKNQAG